jgi:predicted nucleotidyltransferase component of viral defense system
MIPRAFIIEWSQYAPWKNDEQIEQDLVISRALVEIFSNDFLSENLAFRGGTALHKLYFTPAKRYSEDIDLVQIKSGPFGPIVDEIKKCLSFLGEPKRDIKKHNFTLQFKFDSESLPVMPLKLKVETNIREHFSVFGIIGKSFSVKSSYYRGSCNIPTYCLEELLGTKFRALYQRKKGRDLFDLYLGLIEYERIDVEKILESFRKYISFSTQSAPNRMEYLLNLEKKMTEEEFLGDIVGLLREQVDYNPQIAFNLVRDRLIEKLS